MNATEASRKGIEMWAACYGFHGLYEVSNLGRVRSVRKRLQRADGRVRFYGGKMLKASPDHYGYPRVTLSNKTAGEGLTYRKVFHLVWLSFLGQYDEPVLRHRDDDKNNSALYNLTPGTYKENMADAIRNGRQLTGQNRAGAYLLNAEVVSIRSMIAKGNRGVDIAKHFNVSPQTISDIKYGRRRVSG